MKIQKRGAMETKEKAQKGLSLLKESILGLLKEHPNGLQNVDIATKLAIRSNYLGKHEGYFCWSILGLLLNEKKIRKEGKKYFIRK